MPNVKTIDVPASHSSWTSRVNLSPRESGHHVGNHPATGLPARDQTGVTVDPVGNAMPSDKRPGSDPANAASKPNNAMDTPTKAAPKAVGSKAALYGQSKATNRNSNASVKPAGSFVEDSD
jgi:hypothetical protein